MRPLTSRWTAQQQQQRQSPARGLQTQDAVPRDDKKAPFRAKVAAVPLPASALLDPLGRGLWMYFTALLWGGMAAVWIGLKVYEPAQCCVPGCDGTTTAVRSPGEQEGRHPGHMMAYTPHQCQSFGEAHALEVASCQTGGTTNSNMTEAARKVACQKAELALMKWDPNTDSACISACERPVHAFQLGYGGAEQRGGQTGWCFIFSDFAAQNLGGYGQCWSGPWFLLCAPLLMIVYYRLRYTSDCAENAAQVKLRIAQLEALGFSKDGAVSMLLSFAQRIEYAHNPATDVSKKQTGMTGIQRQMMAMDNVVSARLSHGPAPAAGRDLRTLACYCLPCHSH
jgi:hypothetical protein